MKRVADAPQRVGGPRGRAEGGRPSRSEGDPLRIALLDSWSRDPSVGSGSAAAVSGLAAALEARGHAVVRPGRPLAVGSGRVPSPLSRLAFNLALPLQMRDLRHLDLVVGVDIDGVFLRPDASVPYVVCLKGIAADEARFERGAARRRLRALAALERRNAARAERVIVPSRYSHDVAAELYGLSRARIRVVPEGIEFAFWAAPEDEDGPDGGAVPPPSRPPTILTVARHYPRKNTRALLRALPSVIRAVPDARLRIVGGGPELPRIRRLVAELGLEGRVDVLGPVPTREDVRREYRRADLFCLPSLQEGFGIAFLEAMAAGLPVVALRAAAVPEIVRPGVTGILVEPDRPRGLSDALALLLHDPERRARMARAARARAGRYDWHTVGDRFLAAALGP